MAPSLSTMPSEVYLECTKLLPDFKSLQNFKQTCKRANAIIATNERRIYAAIVPREIGPELFPIAMLCAIAKHESSGLPSAIADCKDHPGDGDRIDKYERRAVDFCKTRLSGQAMVLEDPIPELTLQMLHEMWDFHTTARIYADGYMEKLNCKLPPGCRPISSSERLWAFRAFYILELVRLVAPFEPRKEHEDPAFDAFWRAWAPWEKSQVTGIFSHMRNLACARATVLYPGHWRAAPYPQRFVVHAGLRNVHALLCDEEAAATQFSNLQWYNESGQRQYRWLLPYPRNYTDWLLPPDRHVPATGASLNMPNIMKAYKDFGNDSGPRDAWFFAYIGRHAMGRMDWPDGSDRYRKWAEHSRALGIFHGDGGYMPFLSRERLDSLFDLPSMEEMVEASREVYQPSRGRRAQRI
ncbi:hypothetical protein SLS62_003398 [Diatrype stigma]|uniref:F-box domain-containing protein n=1 Tax=Diatrype stigma TaxID=117547 RepID=A0AAN9UYI1_9PEZI